MTSNIKICDSNDIHPFQNYIPQPTKQCTCCGETKEMDQFETYQMKSKKFYTKSQCIECKDKGRCHTCKQILNKDRFYMTKNGCINSYKCKGCYKKEFNEIIRESPL